MTIYRKSTWKNCEDPQILAVYNEVYEETKRLFPEYFDTKIEFCINSGTKTRGLCAGNYTRPKQHYDTYKNIRWEKVFIVLSKYITDPEDARKTIVHEFGHLVTPSEDHSRYWLARANEIGKKWNIICSRFATEEQGAIFRENVSKERKIYKVVCTGCGRIVYRRKMCNMIKYPSSWSCGLCGHKFKNA